MASGGGGEQGTEMVDISDEQLSRMRGQPEPFPNATSNPMLAAAAEEDDDGEDIIRRRGRGVSLVSEEEYEQDSRTFSVPSWKIRDSQQDRRKVVRYMLAMLFVLTAIALTVVFSTGGGNNGSGGGSGGGRGGDE